MRRIVVLMVVLGLLVALGLIVGASAALADPGSAANTAGCVTCHKGDPVAFPGAPEIYQAAHDSAVGECLTCHAYEDESIHGQWDDTPEACARCHRTHSAVEDDLLVMEKDTLCLFCHGRGAGLAQTNVLDGLLRLDSGSLRAGGFENATMETSTHSGNNSAGHATTVGEWQFPVSGAGEVSVTSKHTLGVEATIWGAWDTAGFSTAVANAGDTNTTLECVSCHDPHAYGQTYRMLTRRPGDSGVAKHPDGASDPWEQRVFVTDQLTFAEYNPLTDVLAYTTPDYSKLEIGTKSWDAGNATWVATKVSGTSYSTVDVLDDTGSVIQVTTPDGSSDMYSQQLAAWCASCHDRYNSQSTADTGDLIFAHRHQTAQPVTGNETVGYATTASPYGDRVQDLSCVSCHVAHGTSAQMTPYVTAMPWPGEGVGDGPDVNADGEFLNDGNGTLATDVRAEFTGGTDHDAEARSNLLRIDNRGVCQNPSCHPKGKTSYLNPYDDH